MRHRGETSAVRRRDGCPFFGARPDSLALIESDLALPDPEVVAWWSRLVNGAGRGDGAAVRWALGFGRPFFEPAGSSPAAFGWSVAALRFNGDERCRPPPDTRPRRVLLALGGEWQAVLDEATTGLDLLAREEVPGILAHFCSHQGSQRDPTGFLDGTSNLQELTADQFAECVFVPPGDAGAPPGSTYLVFRKYEEDLRMWNTLADGVQEQIVGRRKADGAFLDGGMAWGPAAREATLERAHVRCVNPRAPAFGFDWRQRVYRRSIPYRELHGAGVVREGVAFLALSRDPREQVETIHNQRLLPSSGGGDLLLGSGYVVPRRSACYLLPPPSVACRWFRGGAPARVEASAARTP